jgi:hypothetical protein
MFDNLLEMKDAEDPEQKDAPERLPCPGAPETDYEVQQQDETGSPVRVQIITPSFTTQQHESTTVPVFVQTI